VRAPALALAIAAAGCGGPAREVLWIGNSLTFHHNQPRMVERLAAAGGRRVRVTVRAVAGASLQDHWDAGPDRDADGKPTARALLRRCGWSDVVLQEYSDRALADPEGFRATVHAFADEARARCPTARLRLFENWPYATARDWDGDAARLHAAYAAVAREVGATVVPDGLAFALVPPADRRALYDDAKHPSVRGAYLAALVMARTLVPHLPHAGWWPPEVAAGGAHRLDHRARRAVRAWPPQAQVPPSITSSAPVMWAPSSDASIAIAPATSSGRPEPRGACTRRRSFGFAPSGSANSWKIGVATSHGRTAFARSPCRA